MAPPPPTKPKSKADIKEELRKDLLLLNLLKVQLQPIMDQIKKYKKFRQPVIADSLIQYLWAEADPNYVRPDLVEPEDGSRPFELSKDKDGVSGLLEVATGKFFYNLDLAIIEERLSNGFYARPRDFYRDVCSLAKDAKNTGDKERVLKANELVTNVEVDVAEAEARLIQADWEGLHQRQLQRARDAAERARKRKATQSMIDLIHSNNDSQRDADDSQERLGGPVIIGEPIPGGGGHGGLATVKARFRLRSPSPSPLSNGRGDGDRDPERRGQQQQQHASNGTDADADADADANA